MYCSFFFPCSTSPAAAINGSHFSEKINPKGWVRDQCCTHLWFMSSDRMFISLCSASCTQSFFFLSTQNIFVFLIIHHACKLPCHQVFCHAGWTVWGHTLHSRCCEHGTTAKVRQMFLFRSFSQLSADNARQGNLSWQCGRKKSV